MKFKIEIVKEDFNDKIPGLVCGKVWVIRVNRKYFSYAVTAEDLQKELDRLIRFLDEYHYEEEKE